MLGERVPSARAMQDAEGPSAKAMWDVERRWQHCTGAATTMVEGQRAGIWSSRVLRVLPACPPVERAQLWHPRGNVNLETQAKTKLTTAALPEVSHRILPHADECLISTTLTCCAPHGHRHHHCHPLLPSSERGWLMSSQSP